MISSFAARTLIAVGLLAFLAPRPARATEAGQDVELRCDRNVDADLLTVADRMADNRLEAAHAYLDALLDCEQGRKEPQVFLLLAEVDERLGRLNEAHRWLAMGAQVAGEAGRLQDEVERATEIFFGRWVRVDLLPVGIGASGPELAASGPVLDDVARQLLTELAAARSIEAPEPRPGTCWLTPGEYLLGDRTMRLTPGMRIELPAERASTPAP